MVSCSLIAEISEFAIEWKFVVWISSGVLQAYYNHTKWPTKQNQVNIKLILADYNQFWIPVERLIDYRWTFTVDLFVNL